MSIPMEFNTELYFQIEIITIQIIKLRQNQYGLHKKRMLSQYNLSA